MNKTLLLMILSRVTEFSKITFSTIRIDGSLDVLKTAHVTSFGSIVFVFILSYISDDRVLSSSSFYYSPLFLGFVPAFVRVYTRQYKISSHVLIISSVLPLQYSICLPEVLLKGIYFESLKLFFPYYFYSLLSSKLSTCC